ncbi:MAG: zinc ribbon domain-containing protein [Acidobacteria bacterium]|nr:zinc ribbon domain-containing protein [Acidobacteriota bacterium]
MPIYEYRCQDCRRRVSVWVRRMGEEAESCPHCGGRRLERLVSRFALARSDESRLEHLTGDAALAGVDENDPKSVARFMKRMGQDLGEDAGPEFEQAIEEMEHGGPEAGEDTTAPV